MQRVEAQLEETVRVLQGQVNAAYCGQPKVKLRSALGTGGTSPTSMEGNANVSSSPANAQGAGCRASANSSRLFEAGHRATTWDR